MATVVIVVRTVPTVVTAHMVRTMPAMVTTHMMMAIAVTMMVAILHLGRQAFTGSLHGCGNARIVERHCVRLLRRRSDEHQACDGGEAEKLFQVHCSLLDSAGI